MRGKLSSAVHSGRRSGLRPLLAVAAAASVVSWPIAMAPIASAATKPGMVYVVQGIAGTTGAITLDGRIVARDVQPKTVVGPLKVDPGAHTVQLWHGQDPVAQAWFSARAGSSTDLVAHRFPDAARAPAFTTYTNNISPTPAGKSRLLVAHTAIAPPSNIVVNKRVLIRNLANGEFAANVVPAGKYEVSVVPAATTGPPILGPSSLTVDPGQLVNVFAIGDASAGRMDAVVQVLPIGSAGAAMPNRVETGDGGQAAALFPENHSRGPVPAMILAVAAALAAAGAAWKSHTPRRARL